ncbi:Plasmin-sensitive surface protein [Moraxella atlantae]|uniref:Plasmin-sensitive surface protein n=2 Tax=Faucicola atlantae TaxID=34059 RepID=A0A378Q4G1_9GAMM|nr:Plasmin-sensitive surface protein [Moraxella atlantae]
MPLLADACGISLAQAQATLTPLLTTCVYRTAYFATYQPKYLVALLSKTDDKTCAYLTTQSGFTLTHLAMLVQDADGLTMQLFTDTAHWHALLGTLIAPSRLDLVTLDKLAKLIVSLSLITLSWLWRDSQNATANISLAQLTEWLKQQPVYLHHINIDSATWCAWRMLAGYQGVMSFRAEQRVYQDLNKYGLAGWQQALANQLQSYTARQPLAIVPKKPPKYTPKALSISTSKRQIASSGDIFAKPTRQTTQKTLPLRALYNVNFAARLQQHWIATAVGLSALVFGGLAWAWSAFVPKSVTNTTNTIASAPKTQTYQDVAIVRVASGVEHTASTTTKHASASSVSATKSDNQQAANQNKASTTSKNTASSQAQTPDRATKPTKDKTTTDKTTTDQTNDKASTQTSKASKQQNQSKTSQATGKKDTDKKDTDKKNTHKKTADKKTTDKKPTDQQDAISKTKKSDRKSSKASANDDGTATGSDTKNDKAKSTRKNTSQDNNKNQKTTSNKTKSAD